MWTKGPRCGVDNCPSRFWQVLDGSQVCQYGHVREGVEIGEDEEDFVHGRRIKRPKLDYVETEKESRSVFGQEAETIVASCLQKVLQLQLKYMTDHHISHPGYGPAVKMLWLGLAKGTKLGGSGGKLTLGLNQSIAILYLGCVLCRIPIYLIDFHRLVHRYELPYFDAYATLFGRTEVPPNLIDRVRPKILPGLESLYEKSRAIAAYLEQHEQISFPEVMPGPLVFKVVRDLLLPPTIYGIVMRLLRILDASFRLDAKAIKALAPENLAVFTVVVAVKMSYGLDGVERAPAQTSPAADEFDWSLWADLVTKLWLLDDEFSYADERSVIYWDDDKVDRYIHWFRRFVLTDTMVVDPTVVQKRMFDMFPLADDRPAPGQVTGADYDDVVPELIAALHETSRVADRTGANPGSKYKQYSNIGAADWQLPPLIETLYLVAGRFLHMSPEQVRVTMQRVESYFRRANQGIYLAMEKDGLAVWVPPSRMDKDLLEKRRAQRDANRASASASPIPPSPFQSSSGADSPGDQSRRI